MYRLGKMYVLKVYRPCDPEDDTAAYTVMLGSILSLLLLPPLFAVSTPLTLTPSLTPISLTSPNSFACLALDWWPTSKCDYGTCAWGNSSFINLDLNNGKVKSALVALGGALVAQPFYLRLGGSLVDFVRYEVPGYEGECVEFSAPTTDTRVGYELGTGCLKQERWDDLNNFCSSIAGCELIFGLNALVGRQNSTCPAGTDCQFDSENNPCCTSWSGSWDPTNARQLIEYSASQNHSLYGYELGNELAGVTGIEAHLTPAEYAETFCTLHQIIDDVYGGNEHRPKLITPDNNFEHDWIVEFVKIATERGCTPDVVTWHQYLLGAGVDDAAPVKAMDPMVLDQQIAKGGSVLEAVTTGAAGAAKVPEVWVGEAGGAYNSGRRGTTDCYRSSFWFLDGLGVLSEQGHSTFCRQTLIGGNYGLLSTTTYDPNPDYWGLLLWQRLMGREVLAVDVGVGNDGHFLRSYAHCAVGGGGKVAMLLMNLNSDQAFEVTVEGEWVGREDYVMTATDMESQQVMLNGKVLEMAEAGDVELEGVKADGDFAAISVGPEEYGYFVFQLPEGEECGMN